MTSPKEMQNAILDGAEIITQAKAYLDSTVSGVPGVLNGITVNGELPDGVVDRPTSMTLELSNLNTDTSDDTNVADITPDSWGGQVLNIRTYLSDIEWKDDSAMATKIIDALDSTRWTGVEVTKHDFQMVMTFNAPIDATIDNILSDSTVIVETIDIYANTGTREAPVYDLKIAETTDSGTEKYYDYINNFGLLDATTSSTTNELQHQGTLFAKLVDADTSDDFDLPTIFSKILPDFLYPDWDIGDSTAVDLVEIFRYDSNKANAEQLVASLDSADAMLVGEVDAYVDQIFG